MATTQHSKRPYDLASMSPENINRVIHERLLRHSPGQQCAGPITVHVTAHTENPNSCRWACVTCGAGGEYHLVTGAGMPGLAHTAQPPDYFHSLERALDVLRYIGAHRARRLQELMDFYLFSIDYRNGRMQPISSRPIVSRLLQIFTPERVCFAAIHAMRALESERAEEGAQG